MLIKCLSPFPWFFPEGVDWPNCRKCSFLIFFPTCNHGNLNLVKKDHVHQKMVKIGWPRVIWGQKWDHTSGLRSPQMGPQLHSGTIFIPKTRYSWLPYTMRPSCMFKNRIQGGQKMTFSTPSWLIFSKGNGWISVSHQPLDLFPSFFLQWCYL